jgi:putative acetyltransferase
LLGLYISLSTKPLNRREINGKIDMIARAAEPEEYEEVYDLLQRAFKGSRLECTIVKVTTEEDINFQKGDLRVTEVNGKIVSMMMLIRRPLRIGTAVVNGAIVAPVATHPDHQRRGYCSSVMRDAVQYMRIQGFDLSILHGIPWLYPRYGYSPAMVKTELVINPKQVTTIENVPCEYRSIRETDLKQIIEIYHSNTAMRTLAEIRSLSMWEWKHGGSGVDFEVFTDKTGEVIGYCALGTDWNRPCAHEIGVLNDEACESIFNRLLETARKKDLEELYCLIHPDHPFAHFAFWRNGEIRIRARRSRMALVLNLISLFIKMKGEFERRLRYSEFHDVSCSLRISSEKESAVLEIDRGQVFVNTDSVNGKYQIDIPLALLNPLVTGYKDIKEIVKDSKVIVKGGDQPLRLVEVLFPQGLPFGGSPPLVWG